MKQLVLWSLLLLLFGSTQQINAQNTIAHQQNARLGRGVNMIGYDRALWKDHTKGRFKEHYFQMIKDAGFQSVRVNLHAFSHMDEAYQLDSSFLKTLDWTVENALKAGLMVILDMHEFNAMADDPVGKKEMFLSVWRQLAPRYQYQPSSVLFEILNEPNRKLTVELWNEYLVEAIAIIRESNPERTLIIGPGNWNGIESLPTLELPEDDRNIIVTVHFYHPMPFTHQGAPWSAENKDLSGIPWTGTDQEKADVVSKLRKAAEWAEANNRPIFLGEFGAYDKADMDSRARYTAFVARTAEILGFSWAYWQFDSDFIVYDIDREDWVEPILNALIEQQ
ncbi:MAG: glycoside hydrolase family 5 protein [Prolixibacteraceae bacterium]|nr:glycoside hydrolase family 5 protein [Prolixibacteraceae bacterium]